jgi:hypothetical protein
MSKVAAFFTGLGQGYMQGKENLERKAREKKRDEREDEEYEAKRKDRKRQEDERQALVTAARPVEVVAGANGMTLPETMDNRDVGLPENDSQPNGGLVPGVRVGGQAFADPKAAAAAAEAANTPQAVRNRQVAALQGFDPERAMRLEATSLQIDGARAEQAKKLKEEGVFDAMRAFRSGDAKTMKEAFNKSGQFKIDGDVTLTPEVRDIPGVGKITTYTATFNAIGPDGKAVQKSFNSHDLSMQMMPYEKALELQQKGTKEVREAAKDASVIKENEAKAGYYTAAAGAATTKAEAASTNAAGKPLKLDEDDKLRLTTANTRVRDAEKAVADAMAKLMPGDDPTKAPGVTYAQGLLRQAKLDHLRTNIELGQIPPKAMVNQILGVAKNPQEVLKSLTELASVGGADYADQVAAEIQGTDAWKAMNPQAKPKTAGTKPAAASGGMPVSAPAAAPPAPPKGAPPGTDTAGQRQDQAREVLRRLQASAPGLAKGRQALDDHAAAVEAARAELRDAEAAYQRMVEGAVKPYFGGGRATPAAAAGMTAGAR